MSLTCLNPYCSGRWSRTRNKSEYKHQIDVLILIVVEDGLVRRVAWNTTRKALRVLILIVVEDGLVPQRG